MKFLLGFAIGFATGVLFAPAPGSQTRRAFMNRVRRLSDLPRAEAENMANIAQQKAGDIGAEVGRRAAQSAVEAVKENFLGKQTA
jgi:gas vesicle protein